MKAFWITSSGAGLPSPLGVGVTARDEQDAIALAQSIAEGRTVLALRRVTDVGELDQGHVVPNMGNILKRGIWFPLGYEHCG